jgi:glycerate kinase
VIRPNGSGANRGQSKRASRTPIPATRRATPGAIPDTLLVAPASFGPTLPAARVAAMIAQGLRAGGLPEPDLCPIELARGGPQELARRLAESDFDARMRRARAVILGERRLDRHGLPRSVTFELATRARQAGVPAYAVTAENALDSFDARILDLQVVLRARTPRALAAAGHRLVELMRC